MYWFKECVCGMCIGVDGGIVEKFTIGFSSLVDLDPERKMIMWKILMAL